MRGTASPIDTSTSLGAARYCIRLGSESLSALRGCLFLVVLYLTCDVVRVVVVAVD